MLHHTKKSLLLFEIHLFSCLTTNPFFFTFDPLASNLYALVVNHMPSHLLPPDFC